MWRAAVSSSLGYLLILCFLSKCGLKDLERQIGNNEVARDRTAKDIGWAHIEYKRIESTSTSIEAGNREGLCRINKDGVHP